MRLSAIVCSDSPDERDYLTVRNPAPLKSDMRIKNPKTEKYHNYQEGDCGKPVKGYFKKRFWKRYDRKRFLKQLLKNSLH